MIEKMEEFTELMAKTNKSINEIIQWMTNHKEDALFKTDEGKQLNKHICNMGWNHAMIYADIAEICLKDCNLK